MSSGILIGNFIENPWPSARAKLAASLAVQILVVHLLFLDPHQRESNLETQVSNRRSLCLRSHRCGAESVGANSPPIQGHFGLALPAVQSRAPRGSNPSAAEAAQACRSDFIVVHTVSMLVVPPHVLTDLVASASEADEPALSRTALS